MTAGPMDPEKAHRTIQELSHVEIDHILADAPNRCYSEIALEMDLGVHTVKRIVRNNRYK